MIKAHLDRSHSTLSQVDAVGEPGLTALILVRLVLGGGIGLPKSGESLRAAFLSFV